MRPKIRELSRYIDGERCIEMFLNPKHACRYYWKALITIEDKGIYRVQFLDRLGKPFKEHLIFQNEDDAKIHVRRTLLNQL